MFLLGLPVAASSEERSLREAVPHDNFVIREEMVAMRDGAKLYTVILTPKDAKADFPILLRRTPYDATGVLRGHPTSRFESILGYEFLGDDYVYVVQDIRGRFKSEGDYFMYRAPRGAFNKTKTDETTDAWDTIDWLVKNVPSNGRVGIWGTSYPGWLTLAAMRDPHAALAAAVPFNPVVDVWKADDWFHWGAFRATYAFHFIYSMETRLDEFTRYPYEKHDLYDWMLGFAGVGPVLGERLDDRHEMWNRIIENPGYGPYWRDVAADRWFDSPPRLVPALHVHGFWDQEDIYGAPAVYEAIETHDRDNDLNFFVGGPWYHGQHYYKGNRLGDVEFDQDTAKRFREDVLAPFLLSARPRSRRLRSLTPGPIVGDGSINGHRMASRFGSTCILKTISPSRNPAPLQPPLNMYRILPNRCRMRRGRTIPGITIMLRPSRGGSAGSWRISGLWMVDRTSRPGSAIHWTNP
jgi:predicted acyl esterase